MKITKEYLKKIIKEELLKEGDVIKFPKKQKSEPVDIGTDASVSNIKKGMKTSKEAGKYGQYDIRKDILPSLKYVRDTSRERQEKWSAYELMKELEEFVEQREEQGFEENYISLENINGSLKGVFEFAPNSKHEIFFIDDPRTKSAVLSRKK